MEGFSGKERIATERQAENRVPNLGTAVSGAQRRPRIFVLF